MRITAGAAALAVQALVAVSSFPFAVRSQQQQQQQQTLVPADAAAAINATAPSIAAVVDSLTRGPFKGETWGRLAAFTDAIGNRLAGSSSFEQGVDW
eukprot:SAG31_NODE_5415_length_2550_cov_1.529172_2_plen_97_part_00